MLVLGIDFELTKQGGELRKIRTAMNVGESWILKVTSVIDLSCATHSRKMPVSANVALQEDGDAGKGIIS